MTAVNDFLAQYPRSARVYRGTLEEFERITGAKVEQATQADVLIYQAAQEGHALATTGRKLATLGSLFAYLQGRELRTDNPMRAVRRERYNVDPAASVKYLDAGAVRAIVGATRDAREAALVASLLHGLRISEACGLDVEQVRGGALVAVMGKGGRARTVPLSVTAQRSLADYIGQRRSGPLFLTRSKRRLSVRMAQDVIYAVTARAGERVNPHRFRHTAATLLLRSGAGLEHVQDFLGHRNANTSRVYARLTADDLRAAVDSANLLGEERDRVSTHPLGMNPVPMPSYPTFEPLRLIEGGRRVR